MGEPRDERDDTRWAQDRAETQEERAQDMLESLAHPTLHTATFRAELVRGFQKGDTVRVSLEGEPEVEYVVVDRQDDLASGRIRLTFEPSGRPGRSGPAESQ